MPPIHAVVGSHFLYNNLLPPHFFSQKVLPLKDWVVVNLLGKDRESFLQAQTTQDLHSIPMNHGKLNTRLDRLGKIQFYFYTLKTPDKLILLTPKNQFEILIHNFNQYIIMEEVLLEVQSEVLPVLYFHVPIIEEPRLDFMGMTAHLKFSSIINSDDKTNTHDGISPYTMEELVPWSMLSGTEIFEDNILGKFLLETSLKNSALSLNKGCYLGQEILTKTLMNRGENCSLGLIKKISINSQENVSEEAQQKTHGKILGQTEYFGETYFLVELKREFRIKHKKLFINDFLGEYVGPGLEGVNFSLWENFNSTSIRDNFIAISQKTFLKNDDEAALKILEVALRIYPDDLEMLEMFGVILGRLGRYEDAIVAFKKLSSLDENAVMPHTNLSLYYMKLGRIEEAESEKSLATVKSFALNHKVYTEEKNREEEKLKKIQNLQKKLTMYQEVLAVDPGDEFANLKIGEIYFEMQNFEKCLYHLECALDINPKLPSAFLYSALSFLELGERERALIVLKEGAKLPFKNPNEKKILDQIFYHIQSFES